MCFIFPALISTRWNNFTCSTASGLYSTPTKSATLSLCRFASGCFFFVVFASYAACSELRQTFSVKLLQASFVQLTRRNKYEQRTIDVDLSEPWEMIPGGRRCEGPLCGRNQTLWLKTNTWLSFGAKVDTAQAAPVRCDSYRPQHCDDTRMWHHPFFSQMTAHALMSNVDNFTGLKMPLMVPA